MRKNLLIEQKNAVFDGFLARMAYVDKKDAKFLRVRFVSLGV